MCDRLTLTWRTSYRGTRRTFVRQTRVNVRYVNGWKKGAKAFHASDSSWGSDRANCRRSTDGLRHLCPRIIVILAPSIEIQIVQVGHFFLTTAHRRFWTFGVPGQSGSVMWLIIDHIHRHHRQCLNNLMNNFENGVQLVHFEQSNFTNEKQTFITYSDKPQKFHRPNLHIQYRRIIDESLSYLLYA